MAKMEKAFCFKCNRSSTPCDECLSEYGQPTDLPVLTSPPEHHDVIQEILDLFGKHNILPQAAKTVLADTFKVADWVIGSSKKTHS